MNSAILTREEAAAWKASLDAYDDIAQLNSLFDERLISLVNRLAQLPETRVLAPIKGEGPIVDALNRAAPVYRAHLWPEDQKQDLAWIAANCSQVQEHDEAVRRAIASYFQIKAPDQTILVDLARETGPTLAYTTAGPAAYSGHTISVSEIDVRSAPKVVALRRRIS